MNTNMRHAKKVLILFIKQSIESNISLSFFLKLLHSLKCGHSNSKNIHSKVLLLFTKISREKYVLTPYPVI